LADKAPSAWQIEQALAAWRAAKGELLGDDLDGDSVAMNELLDAEFEDPQILLRQVIRAAQYNEDMSEMCHQWIARGRRRQDRFDNRRRRLREIAVDLMQLLDTPKVAEFDFDASLRRGPEQVVIENFEKIPEAYIKTEVKRSVDSRALLDDLANGVVVDGASLGIRKIVLTIRGK
jgi:hypothetical protein